METVREVEALAAAPPWFPYRVSWDVTYACNLRCRHCFIIFQDEATMEAAGPRRTTDMAIASAIAKAAPFVVSIAGGEPFAVPHLPEVLRLLHEHDIHIVVATNGLLLERHSVEALAGIRRLTLQISLDGASAESHDAIRGEGTFAATIRNVARIAPHVPVTLALTMTNRSSGELYAFCELAERVGARSIKLSDFIAADSVPDRSLGITADDKAGARVQLLRYFDTHPGSELQVIHTFDGVVPNARLRLGTPPQPMKRECTINPDGWMVPCGAVLQNKTGLGNVLQEPLLEIWARAMTNGCHQTSSCLCT